MKNCLGCDQKWQKRNENWASGGKVIVFMLDGTDDG